MTRNSPSLFLFLGLLLAAGVSAQEEATAFDISLANPGARSLGFGGAFLPLADDATAAFANPAGLVQLLEPELTFEARGQSVDPDPGGTGLSISSEEEISALVFLAFVYPWQKVALAVYRNDFANLTFGSRILGSAGNRAFDIAAANRFEIRNTGISVAYRVTESLSLGAGLSRWEGDLTSERSSALASGDPFAPDQVRLTTINTTDTSDSSFNIGVLWRFAEQWRLGGVYRGGPEFAMRSEARFGTAEVPLDQLPVQIRQFPFALPDTLGLGIAFKSKNEALTLSFEWDLVRYSRLLDSLDDIPDRRDFDLDDGHELHLGFEYVIVRSRPVIALRLGAWMEPDHQLRYFGTDPIDRATFRGGEDQTHYAAGFGFAWKSLKVDFGFDASDLVTTGSFSLIYSF